MVLKILCVGDVVGAPGRRVLARGLRSLDGKHGVDCNIVNVENTASGSGLNSNLYDKLVNNGVNLMTSLS